MTEIKTALRLILSGSTLLGVVLLCGKVVFVRLTGIDFLELLSGDVLINPVFGIVLDLRVVVPLMACAVPSDAGLLVARVVVVGCLVM